jgi:hypothetical protein
MSTTSPSPRNRQGIAKASRRLSAPYYLMKAAISPKQIVPYEESPTKNIAPKK